MEKNIKLVIEINETCQTLNYLSHQILSKPEERELDHIDLAARFSEIAKRTELFCNMWMKLD